MEQITNKLSQLSIKKEKGQYFTTDVGLQEHVVSMIKNKPSVILEPSCGRGDLVNACINRFSECRFVLYEIDKSIQLLPSLKENNEIVYKDFLKTEIDTCFDTIIGNPPFVSQKNANKNMYIQFIDKCYKLLNPNGELIFIVPYSFLRSTSGTKQIDSMLKSGSFTDIYHADDERLFEGASVDVIVFRYQKGLEHVSKIKYNDVCVDYTVTNGIFRFDTNDNKQMVKDVFDVYVGIVSGLDRVFKNEQYGNVRMKTDIDRDDTFIYIDRLPDEGTELRGYLEDNKEKLMNRKICKMTENNWYKFGAIRNNKIMESKNGSRCIYVKTISRKSEIACVDTVRYFGGSLLMMLQKDDNTHIDLDRIVDCINSNEFKKQFMSNGRCIISHNQLANSFIV